MIIEGDVTDSELLCAEAIIAAVSGVFAHMQQVIKGDGAHVAGSLNLGRGGRGAQFVLEEVEKWTKNGPSLKKPG